MTDTPRILLHNLETGTLESWLRTARPGADFRVCNTYADLPGLVRDYRPEIVYSVRFDGQRKFPRDALFAEGGPRWIANGGAGTDHFGTWDPTAVTVTNAAGVAADMMAEYVIGGFLHFTLDVPGLARDQRDGVWNRQRTVRPLQGGTLLIVGLGQTGRALAARARAMGMTVLGTRARPAATDNVDEVHPASALRELLPRADFVAVCTPLTPETRGLIDRDAIGSMKDGAVLADVSRGGVVDQKALAEALRGGRLAGAALDVFETEPLPADNPLWGMENVLISPHCSSVYDGWEEASFRIFLANLDRWIGGRDLVNVVDPHRGY